MSDKTVLLECKNVCKSFGQNMVLQDINLQIYSGEIHALIGQNGAGKSTLVKILTGVYSKDSGEILLKGNPVQLGSPQDAEKFGIAIIHQDQQMVPYFDVTRNAYLGMELTGNLGKLDFKKMRALVDEKLKYINANFTSDRLISTLSIGECEQVAIISALLQNPNILILDEPTASLSNREIKRLFEIMDTLKKSGVTIIYISHHLEEVFKIADRITVLRDSMSQGTFTTNEIKHKDIVTLMIGRELKEFFPKESATIGEVILEIKDLHNGSNVNGVDLVLHAGEILGLAGLVGSGRTETILSVFGASAKTKGYIRINGQDYHPYSPVHAHRSGIALIPEDRRREGIISSMSIAENLSLADTGNWARHGLIRRKLEKTNSKRLISKLNIICNNEKQLVGELSGGNQQKVVVGKWLEGNSNIYIFDQPTTGVDVGAKTEIFKQMIKLAQQGNGIIFISTENDELLGICDRIAVMSRGQIIKEFQSSQATEEDLLYWSSVIPENVSK